MKPSRRASSRRIHIHFLCLCVALIAAQACSRKTDEASDQSPDTEAPSAPTELSAQAASSSSIDLNWKAATDGVGVVAYRVYRSDAASFVASVTSTTYADTGLTAATEYNYTVRAVDAAGNESAASNTATTSTFPAAAAEDLNQSTSNGIQPHARADAPQVLKGAYVAVKRRVRRQSADPLFLPLHSNQTKLVTLCAFLRNARLVSRS